MSPSPLTYHTILGLAGRKAPPRSRRPRLASKIRAPSMTTARRLVQRTATLRPNQQPITSTLLAPPASPPTGAGAVGFASLAPAGGRQARPISRQHQHQQSLRPTTTTLMASLLPRHAPPSSTSSCSSFSTSPGVDELDGGFPTERDFHLAADATLDEVQALVDGLEDTVDDYEANLSVRACVELQRQFVLYMLA